MDLTQAWRPFLEIPCNVSGPENCFFFFFCHVGIQDQSFNNFENDTKQKSPSLSRNVPQAWSVSPVIISSLLPKRKDR